MSSQRPSTDARWHAYAVNQREHVLQPTVTSTLFPHLSQEQSAPFRLALLAIAATLVLLGYLRLSGPFVALASAAIPLLYAVYVSEVAVYWDEPVYSIGITAGVGVVLGTAWALLTRHYVTQTILLNALVQGAPVGRVLTAGVLFPLVAQLLMLVGPVIVRMTRPHDSVRDGFALGAIAALGFVLASNLVYLTPELLFGPYVVASGMLSALRAVLHGLLVPLIDAGTTGIVAAALWLQGRKGLPQYGWTTSVWTNLAVAGAIQVGLGLTDILVLNSATAILIYLAAAIVLLFWVRIALHLMLLTEGRGDGSGPVGQAQTEGGTS